MKIPCPAARYCKTPQAILPTQTVDAAVFNTLCYDAVCEITLRRNKKNRPAFRSRVCRTVSPAHQPVTLFFCLLSGFFCNRFFNSGFFCRSFLCRFCRNFFLRDFFYRFCGALFCRSFFCSRFFSSRLFRFCRADDRLCRRKARDRYAVGRARNVIEADAVAEVDRRLRVRRRCRDAFQVLLRARP